MFEECYRPTYGPVLSETIQYLDDQSLQFTTNAVLLFDLKHPPVAGQPCLFASGVTMQLAEPSAPQREDALYVHGHNVHPLLKDAYLAHQEEWGVPIAEPFIEKFSLVQYFANLGVRLHLHTNRLDLLPYGAWLLARLNPKSNEHLTIGSYPPPESVRAWQPVLGLALLPENQMGASQLLPFSNLVLRMTGEGRLGIRPLNIVELLVNEQVLVLPQTTPSYPNLVPSPHPLYPSPVFEPFDRFIAAHGGYDLVGYPLAPPHPFREGVRQCFTNTCLYYDPGLPTDSQVFPLPVGRYYWARVADETLTDLINSSAGVTLRLTLPANEWPPGQPLQVRAYLAILGEPAPDKVLRLTTLLNGEAVGTARQAVTDERGLATFTLPPLEAKAGATVEIKVCYDGRLGDEPVCASEVVFVWDVP